MLEGEFPAGKRAGPEGSSGVVDITQPQRQFLNFTTRSASRNAPAVPTPPIGNHRRKRCRQVRVTASKAMVASR